MLVEILNGSLQINIRYEHTDSTYDDNVCLCFKEPCHDDEKLFRANETNLFLTPKEARTLAKALLAVAEQSDFASHDAL